jgi:hypothetical protein
MPEMISLARAGLAVAGVDVDGAVVLDVDLGAGLGDDALDGLAAGADEEADLVTGLILRVSMRGA